MGVFVYRTRRHEIRRALGIPCSVVRDRDFRLVGGRILDISPGGVLVAVDAAVPLGEGVLVSFQATTHGLWFDSDATVTRVLRGRRPGDPNGLALGLEMTSLDAVARLILRGYLRNVPPPLPRRERVIDYARTVEKFLSIPPASAAA